MPVGWILAGAILVIALGGTVANAKTFNASYQSEEALKANCKGKGKFLLGENSYSCTFDKQGNIKECSKREKKCIIETPKPDKVGSGKPTKLGTGLLDGDRGMSSGAPAPTGMPANVAPVPAQIR